MKQIRIYYETNLERLLNNPETIMKQIWNYYETIEIIMEILWNYHNPIIQ